MMGNQRESRAIFLSKISSFDGNFPFKHDAICRGKIANKFNKLRSLTERQEINRKANDDKRNLKSLRKCWSRQNWKIHVEINLPSHFSSTSATTSATAQGSDYLCTPTENGTINFSVDCKAKAECREESLICLMRVGFCVCQGPRLETRVMLNSRADWKAIEEF